MTDAFEAALAFVMEHEGGYVNHPSDPGGETKFGICKRSYPNLDIRNLTREQAAGIYWRDYWQRACCEALPPVVAMMHFDTAVNQGIGAAARLLQAAAGVEQDGQIGPKTLAAVQRANPRALLVEYAARRAVRYATSRGFDVFGLGWSRRLTACLAHCLGWGYRLCRKE